MKNSKKIKEEKKKKKYLRAIGKIEKIRAKNNHNWMDILRLAIKHAPDEAINLMKKINQKDQTISKLFNKIKN
jgi:hypothetical protein